MKHPLADGVGALTASMEEKRYSMQDIIDAWNDRNYLPSGNLAGLLQQLQENEDASG